MNCKKCGYLLTDSNQPCPNCGTLKNNSQNVKANKSKRKKPLALVVIALLLIITGGVLLAIKYLNPSNNSSGNKKYGNAVSKIQTRASKNDPGVNVSLDGMSAADAVSNLLDSVEIANGDRATSYANRFILPEDAKFVDDNKNKFGSSPSWKFSLTNSKTYIDSVEIVGVTETKDGFISVDDRTAHVDISIVSSDESTIRKIYDELTTLYKKIGNVVEKNEGQGLSKEVEYNEGKYTLVLDNNKKINVMLPVMYFMDAK